MESADEFNHCEWRDDNACDETLTGACGRCTDCRDCNNCPYCEATRLRVDDDYWCWFVGDGTCDEVAGGWCPMCTDCSDCGGCGEACMPPTADGGSPAQPSPEPVPAAEA